MSDTSFDRLILRAESLHQLLNRLVAIVKCGAGTYTELAKFLGKRPQQINEWLLQRVHEPSGSMTMQMQVWASSKTLVIAAAGRHIQTAYRTQYRLATERFPVAEKE